MFNLICFQAGRQAYVQLPLYQQNLASLVEKDPPSPAVSIFQNNLTVLKTSLYTK